MLTILDLDKIRMKVSALDYVNKCQKLVIYLSKSLNKIKKKL